MEDKMSSTFKCKGCNTEFEANYVDIFNIHNIGGDNVHICGLPKEVEVNHLRCPICDKIYTLSDDEVDSLQNKTQ